MKTTNNYEAPVAEMIEMQMPIVLAASAETPTPISGGGEPGLGGGGDE